MKRTIALKLAYDGSGFRGWQQQPGMATVQGAIEEALARVLGKRPAVHGSARTDAGVHAEGQVASFVTGRPFEAGELIFPSAIRLLEVAEASPSFHARASSIGKDYRYRFSWGAVDEGFFLGRDAAPEWGLARAALDGLEGLAQLSGLASPSKPHRPAPPLSAWSLEERESTATLLVSGPAFRKHQLRNLAGHLATVALGLAEPRTLATLAARARPWMGATAPAHGLSLLRVRYPRELDPFLKPGGQNGTLSSVR